jgi:hypothetical protein
MKKNNGKKRRKTLKTAAQCRLFLAKIVNELYDERLEPDIGRACIYGVSMIIKSIEISEIEERLTRLENLTDEN